MPSKTTGSPSKHSSSREIWKIKILQIAKRNRRSRRFCRENLQLNAERPASRRFSKKPHIYSAAEGTGMNKCARASNETRKDSSLTKRETKQHCADFDPPFCGPACNNTRCVV